MRESVETKAERYLIQGRVSIVSADDRSITASVKGDSGHYTAARNHSRWACSCPARGRCCHLLALQRVCSLPGSAVLR